MNKYYVLFQFTEAFFNQNKYDREIESKLNINDFTKALKNTLIAKNEPIRVLKVNQINNN
tara:strand:+ start:374 stop:553 length:180 start_codon:yes stop_codon:yes gene_type:complete